MKPASVKLRSVGYSVYHDLSEFNRTIEEVLAVTGRLATVPFLRGDYLKAHQFMIEEIRVSINDSVTEIVQDREFNNAAYYERRRREWQKQFEDPADVLLVPRRHKRRGKGKLRTKGRKTKKAGTVTGQRKAGRP